MIGIYDYTVWLTYGSAASAVIGILIALSGHGHPYGSALCLLISGLFDAFDGHVARLKKNRTESERNYGIQIDSLSDLVAFGVLPVCIGVSLRRRALFSAAVFRIPFFLLLAVSVLYVLAALIRLAYFNVTEIERQQAETGCREFYTGLPVTSASLIFPTLLLIQHFVSVDLSLLYYLLLLVTAMAFVLRFRLRKPRLKAIIIMVGIGFAEFMVILIARFFFRHA